MKRTVVENPGVRASPTAADDDSPDAAVSLPPYLQQTYWWAYLHPRGVRFFERQWLVNLILWGNYSCLRDAVLSELGAPARGRVLQVACVYGDFTGRLAERIAPHGCLDVVDVAPVQLANLRRKIGRRPGVALHRADSGSLAFPDSSFDHVVVFFLLHEQPEAARARTVHEALRVLRPGGKAIFVDYHRPTWRNPLRYLMAPLLHVLEPYARGLWIKEILDWVPAAVQPAAFTKETYFGGLYQKVVLVR